ncbi:hypothetical protein L484_011488 [Morus notabilis]|uniref:Timeless N-terminal domain-containing protein n=1 Tax=Morus notabilis TaxID=981085 RepID=W9RGA6_9ROSA|nr:hypothetical protein L484_011488 [Morus notabilis]
MPIEPSSNDISDQIEYLWRFKSSITCSDIVAVIVSLLESPLENLERDALTEDDWKLVQLILTLFRNILAIQEISLQQKAGGTASHFISLRDKFLELLFRENVMDLIIVITQHFGGYLRNDNLLLLDIFHYAFMGQEPELVAKAHLKGPKADENSKASLNSLKSIMEEEEEKRKLSRVRNLVRHSHFIGTFSRLTMDGSKAVFNAKPTSVSRDTLIKPHKVHRGPTKKIAWDHGILPSSKDEILKLLHDFVNHFLSGGGYNVLMQLLREDIEKEHHSVQQSDVIVFFQVAQFVTSFQYYKFFTFKPNIGADTSEVLDDAHADKTHFGGDMCGPIAASMNESMFQLVFSHWRNTFEGLKETHNFKFLSAAGSLMKNMICMLDLVLTVLPEDSKESQTARILLYKLFYDQTDQGLTQFLLNLLKSFDTHKQAKSSEEEIGELKGNTSSTLDGGFDGQESNNNAKKAVEHASERVAKIKKRIVLGSELDEKIRNLYEKFKDSQDCSQLIAEDLDSDGRVSSLQVSKKLKQLGLKRASRKRLRRADVPSSFDPDKLDGEKNGVETVGTLGDSNDLEKTLLSQPA